MTKQERKEKIHKIKTELMLLETQEVTEDIVPAVVAFIKQHGTCHYINPMYVSITMSEQAVSDFRKLINNYNNEAQVRITDNILLMINNYDIDLCLTHTSEDIPISRLSKNLIVNLYDAGFKLVFDEHIGMIYSRLDLLHDELTEANEAVEYAKKLYA